MKKNLKEIILKLQKNEEFKQTCKIWCDEATTSCADKHSLSDTNAH